MSTKPTISLIFAADLNNGIGYKNQMPWHLSADLKRFKQITKGHAVVMGRRTWESLPIKPLPGRKNFVLTRNNDFKLDNAIVIHQIDEIFELCDNENEIFVIGGAQIYKEFYTVSSKLYLTRILSEFVTDTKLSFFNEDDWMKINSSETLFDEKLNIKYSFIDYIRK